MAADRAKQMFGPQVLTVRAVRLLFPLLLPPTLLNHSSSNECDTDMYGEKWEHTVN